MESPSPYSDEPNHSDFIMPMSPPRPPPPPSCAGTYAHKHISCELCTQGTYAPTAQTGACLDCPPGFFTGRTHGATTCSACGECRLERERESQHSVDRPLTPPPPTVCASLRSPPAANRIARRSSPSTDGGAYSTGLAVNCSACSECSLKGAPQLFVEIPTDGPPTPTHPPPAVTQPLMAHYPL